MLTINSTFSRRKRYRIYLRVLRWSFTFRVPCIPVFHVPGPRPARPRVPYLMSSSPSSRVPKSQVPTHASRWPVPLSPSHFYTQPQISILTTIVAWRNTSTKFLTWLCDQCLLRRPFIHRNGHFGRAFPVFVLSFYGIYKIFLTFLSSEITVQNTSSRNNRTLPNK